MSAKRSGREDERGLLHRHETYACYCNGGMGIRRTSSPCGHPASALPACAGKPRWAREYAYRASMPALGASGSVNACVIFSILAQPSATVLVYGERHAVLFLQRNRPRLR